jgi:hypothetical protein
MPGYHQPSRHFLSRINQESIADAPAATGLWLISVRRFPFIRDEKQPRIDPDQKLSKLFV